MFKKAGKTCKSSGNLVDSEANILPIVEHGNTSPRRDHPGKVKEIEQSVRWSLDKMSFLRRVVVWKVFMSSNKTRTGNGISKHTSFHTQYRAGNAQGAGCERQTGKWKDGGQPKSRQMAGRYGYDAMNKKTVALEVPKWHTIHRFSWYAHLWNTEDVLTCLRWSTKHEYWTVMVSSRPSSAPAVSQRRSVAQPFWGRGVETPLISTTIGRKTFHFDTLRTCRLDFIHYNRHEP